MDEGKQISGLEKNRLAVKIRLRGENSRGEYIEPLYGGESRY